MKELSRGACGEGQRSNHTDEEAECAICLEKEYSDESAMIRMQCSHIFHSDCITPWFEERLGKSCACPVCPFQMPLPSFEELSSKVKSNNWIKEDAYWETWMEE